MSRLYLFGSEYEEDSIEVIALLTKVEGKSQSEREKKLGLDFLGLSSDDTNIHFLANDYILRNYGLSEYDLLDIFEEHINMANGTIEVAEFYLDDDGYVSLDIRNVSNINKKNNRNSRRYILVEFCGRFYMTDVTGLDNATLHYKDARDRNQRGLQWENFIAMIKHGAVYA